MEDLVVNIPLTMDAVVRSMGGVVSDDTKDPNKSKNADYWFPESHVIAELKCWTEDLAAKLSFKKQLQALHSSWVARGLVSPLKAKVTRFRTSDLPLVCATEFMGLIKDRVERLVRESAKQIKNTRTLLDTSAKGLLLLANDGNPLLAIDGVAYALHHILKEHHSSINSLIYFSANERVQLPGLATPAAFWCPMQIQGRGPVDPAFLDRLADGWFRNVRDQLNGASLTVMALQSEPELINSVVFERRPAWPQS